LLVAIPSIRSQITAITIPTIMFTIRCSLLTAVFVSFSVKASALRSLKALTWDNQVGAFSYDHRIENHNLMSKKIWKQKNFADMPSNMNLQSRFPFFHNLWKEILIEERRSSRWKANSYVYTGDDKATPLGNQCLK
jgi:hypothetical protein